MKCSFEMMHYYHYHRHHRVECIFDANAIRRKLAS